MELTPVFAVSDEGFSNNWWSGLTILHNTFTREHNSICDMLKRNNPSWSDQKLYDTARYGQSPSSAFQPPAPPIKSCKLFSSRGSPILASLVVSLGLRRHDFLII